MYRAVTGRVDGHRTGQYRSTRSTCQEQLFTLSEVNDGKRALTAPPRHSLSRINVQHRDTIRDRDMIALRVSVLGQAHAPPSDTYRDQRNYRRNRKEK